MRARTRTCTGCGGNVLKGHIGAKEHPQKVKWQIKSAYEKMNRKNKRTQKQTRRGRNRAFPTKYNRAKSPAAVYGLPVSCQTIPSPQSEQPRRYTSRWAPLREYLPHWHSRLGCRCFDVPMHAMTYTQRSCRFSVTKTATLQVLTCTVITHA